jgi:hypothetical protein
MDNKYKDCHYYEIEMKDFEDCPVTTNMSEKWDCLIEHCIYCSYNPFDSESTKRIIEDQKP